MLSGTKWLNLGLKGTSVRPCLDAAQLVPEVRCAGSRVTRYDPISIWQIDMGDRIGRSDTNEISIGISIWDMGYRFGIPYIDMVIYHIDMVILDIDMAHGLMIWEMTVSIWSSWISIWDILSLWPGHRRRQVGWVPRIVYHYCSVEFAAVVEHGSM